MPEHLGLSYDDVSLVPKRSSVESRSNVDLSTTVAPGVELSVPILSAAMDTVTELDMAKVVADRGGLGVVHRFLPVDEQAAMVDAVADGDQMVAAAVGVNEAYHERAAALSAAGVDLLVVDVAHGHLDRTLEAVDELTERFEVPLCAGNVVTAEGVSDLADAGADCIKIGVGPGSHCTTREVTGFGVPQFTAIERCVPAAHDAGVRTIADGGIRRSGDAVKALLAGADAVMVGGLLAGTDSAPADLVERDGNQYKRTRGMATKAAATERGDKTSDVVASEGVEGLTPYTGATEAFLEEFAAGLRSGLSYAGAHDLTTARKRAEFIRITPEAGRRNGAHGVRTDDEP